MSRRPPAEQHTAVCGLINASIFILYDLYYLSQEVSLIPKLSKHFLNLWGQVSAGSIKLG